MSDNQGASGAPSLQEALAEIEELKEQLSGSDLKVFTQNRELKVDNQKHRDEVTRLAEECVTQTFAVRGLEKKKKALEKQVAEQQSRLTSLEETVSGLESRIVELSEELGVHRSQEIHLSQELERTISTNAEELSKLKTEHSQTVEKTRQDLEQAKVELEKELTGKLRAKDEEVESLLNRVEQFKEEFLSQEFNAVAPAPTADNEGGKAFSLLKSKMEGLLGFPGKTLVEQVFRHCGADESTSDPLILEEAFEALQDTAIKLVRTPEQEVELTTLLRSVWQELGLGSDEATPTAAEPTPQSPPEEPEASSETEPSAETEPQDPEAEKVPDRDPAPAHDAPAHDAPAHDAPAHDAPAHDAPDEALANAEDSQSAHAEEAHSEGNVEESGDEVEPSAELEAEASIVESEAVTEEDLTPAAIPEEPIQEQDLDSMDDSLDSMDDSLDAVEESAESDAVCEPESREQADDEPLSGFLELSVDDDLTPGVKAEPVAEESAEEPDDQEQAPASEGETKEPVGTEADGAEESSEEAAEADFEAAAAALQNGDFESAWPAFHKLRSQEPDEATYLVGEIAALAGLERYQEAYNLGKGLDIAALEESGEVYKESFESVLIGLAEQSESLLQRKLYLVELIHFAGASERLQAYLDEADEIPLRTTSDGYLSLLQAKARIGQDDVTEYLLEVLTSMSDSLEVFELLKRNLQRYPELAPLSSFLEQLLESPRADSLEAESEVKHLLTSDEPIEDLLDETDPGEEALVQVFLEHLLPRTGVKIELPSEQFEDLLADSEDAAFVGALRQALRSVDYTIFFESIEVLSYDGEERFILRSSPEPKPTLLFGSEIDDVPPEELRFLVLRELFSIYRRHSQLAHLAAGLDDALRVTFVKTCLDILREAGLVVPDSLLAEVEALQGLATDGGQDADFRVQLEALLNAVYLATESDSILDVADFLYDGQLNKKALDAVADNFAAKQTSLVVASYAIARDQMESEDFEALEETGFNWLYQSENLEKYSELRLRLQRLWAMPFKALVAENDE